MAQQELFDAPVAERLKRRIKELDSDIEKAMKKRDYAKAKSLNDQQSGLIKEMLRLGERSGQ